MCREAIKWALGSKKDDPLLGISYPMCFLDSVLWPKYQNDTLLFVMFQNSREKSKLLSQVIFFLFQLNSVYHQAFFPELFQNWTESETSLFFTGEVA